MSRNNRVDRSRWGWRWVPLASALMLATGTWSLSNAQTSGAPAAQRLPALGDAVSGEFDLPEERKLGDRIMREIGRDPDVLDDPLLQEYVEQMLSMLLASARQRGALDADMDRLFAWQPFLIRDRAVNAFALPGGYMGVYLGLMALTSTADELASVLAHELTHVMQRHIARAQDSAGQQSAAALAAMLLGVVVASRANSVDGIQAAVVGSQAMMAQGQLNFSRDMEREADRIGLETLSSAGYQPGGMAAMFDKLDGSTRLNDNEQYPYLRSHPLTSERISEARLRATQSPPSPMHPWPYLLMQARAKVLMDPRENSLRRLQGTDVRAANLTDTQRLVAMYTVALASLQLRDAAAAERAWQAAVQFTRDRLAGDAAASRALALLQIELLTAQVSQPASTRPTDLADRLQRAAAALDSRSTARPEMLARAQTALALQTLREPAAQGALRSATEALQTWVTEHPHDATAWQTLSLCAQPIGLQLRALRAGAEAAWARGDMNGAVDRFRAAQAAARATPDADEMESTVIGYRLREVEAERKRLMQDVRGERAN